MRQLMLIAVLVVAMLGVAAPAVAGGNSVLSGHASEPPASQVMHTSKGSPSTGSVSGTASPTKKSPGTLPFTGLDLTLAAGVSVLLLGAGLGLRRGGRNAR